MPNQDAEMLLSAYLDGELTQAEQQRVRIHLEDSDEARAHLEELKRLKELTGELAFPPPPDEWLDEVEQRASVRGPRRIGWLILTVGVVAAIVFGGVKFFAADDVPTTVKWIYGGVGFGLACLLGSVARQRWLERPHDRYRGVKR